MQDAMKTNPALDFCTKLFLRTCIAIGLAGACFTKPGSPVLAQEAASSFPLDQPAPEFVVQDLSGRQIRLADYRGKVVLLSFWATWCPPCREETPALIQLQRQCAKRGFAILGISFDESEAPVQRYVAEKKLNFPVARISPSFDANYGALFHFPGGHLIDKDGLICSTLPTMLVIDRQGRLHSVHVRPREFPNVQREIQGLLRPRN
jgi:cytochrome c biogenesis protein CcmG/thiol:disulfide interchange protein DsbE